jgi:hypothetical protein
MKGKKLHSARSGQSALSQTSKSYADGGSVTVKSSFTVGRSGSDADDISLVEKAVTHSK